MFRCNTYLEARGYRNVTTNFGMGKTNAAWRKDNVIIKRQQAFGGCIEIHVYKNDKYVKTYPVTGDHGKDGIEQFKNDLPTF